RKLLFMANNIWQTIDLGDEKVHFRKLGNLFLWFKYRNDEVWIASCYSDDVSGSVDESEPPNGVRWSRWAHKGGYETIRLKPALANLPLIVHSEYSLKISPHTEIQVYSRVPVWVQILIADKDYQLEELPVSKLPKTWFG